MSGSDGEPAATSAEDAAAPGDAADSGGENRNVMPESDSGAPDATQAPSQPAGGAPTEANGGAAGKTFRIRSEEFGSDVRQARRELGVDDNDAGLLEYVAADCLPADVGAGDVVAATYDGAPAAIVLRTPSGEVQVVDLYLCGDSVPRRSITLTAP
jgi:hypothetical protein